MDNKTKNWMMDIRNDGPLKPVMAEWPFTNSLIGLLGILAPAAFLAVILGHTGTFLDFIINADYWKFKDSRRTKLKKETQTIYFYNWLLSFLSSFRSNPKCGIGTRIPRDIWKDGSNLCNLVNMIVPGACKDPRLHRLQTPEHGQKLVYEYLDIKPIFTPLELTQKSLTSTQEKEFAEYLNKIHQIISQKNDNTNNMKFSTDFVARGMGLVVAQQNRKSTFYIYPIPKQHYPSSSNLEILIKGPCGNNGKITIPSISQYHQKCQPSTEYKRSLYMTSKLNSISPTLQGSSFLRQLSLNTEDPRSEMDINVKLTTTRVKVSYIPEKTGIYEISLVTRGNHVIGSPYSVPVELSAVSNCCSNDTDSENEEESKYTYRKKKIISRIIDFIDEKMLLQDDGTLVKIDSIQNNNYLNQKSTFTKDEEIELLHSKNINSPTEITKLSSNNVNWLERNMNTTFQDTQEENNNNSQSNLKNNNLFPKRMLQNYNKSKVHESNNNVIQSEDPIEEVSEMKENNSITKSNQNVVNYSFINNKHEYSKEETNNKNEQISSNYLSNLQKNQHSDILIINANPTLESASFIANEKQIELIIDPTLDSKVQDPQIDSNNKYKDFSKKSLVGEYPFSSYNSKDNCISSLIKIFDGRSENKTTYSSTDDLALIESPGLVKRPDLIEDLNLETNQYNSINSQSLYKRLKKMGAILTNYDRHQCNLKNHVNCNIQQCINGTTKTQSVNTKNIIGLVEKQKRFWTEQTTSIEDSKSQKQNINNSSISNNFSEYKEEKYVEEAVVPFDGIVENNIKLFEIKPSTQNQTKTSFKIDIPKLNLKETIIVKDIEIVTQTSDHSTNKTQNKDDVIKLPSLAERKIKFLQACNKPVRPKRVRNKVNVNRNDFYTDIEESDVIDNGRIESTKDISIKLVATTDHSRNNEEIKEPNISTRRKYRFKRAKLFFQSLEKPTNSTKTKEIECKHLGHISIKAESDLNLNKMEEMIDTCSKYKDTIKFKNPKQCLHKSNSDSDRCLQYSTEKYSEIPRSESDPCVSFSNQNTPMKISERFLVTDLFRDILEDSRFIGLPNKKAVVASLASLETNCEELDDNYNDYDVKELDYFEKRTEKCCENENVIPGYQTEFPHIPKTNYFKHRSRDNPEITGLIPGRNILEGSIENLIL